jgi:hypothetical protein
MALRECTECGHEVSSKTGACAHCGAPRLRRSASAKAFGGFGMAMAVFILLFAFLFAVAQP